MLLTKSRRFIAHLHWNAGPASASAMRSSRGNRGVGQQRVQRIAGAARRRRRAAIADRAALIAGCRAIVRASSARLSSESGSAHSCVVSPKPFGAGGDQSGCRSCRSTTGAFGLDVAGAERAQHGDEPVLRRAELARVLAPRLGLDRRARARRRLQVAVARAEHARDAIDGRGRRLVAHEVRDQLAWRRTARWTDGGTARGSRARLRRRRPRRSARPSTVLVPGSCSSS